MINPAIQNLRLAIAPCCGLGANPTEVDAALSSVSAQLSTQEQLLIEALNILESSLVALQLESVGVETIDNHRAAIKAIRDALGYQEVLGFPCAVKVTADGVSIGALRMPVLNVPPRQFEPSSKIIDKLLKELAEQPDQLQLTPKVAMSQIDQVIHELFSNNWTPDLRSASIGKMRAQLYKNLKDQLAGYWTGHTAYWILIEGGFIVDGPRGTAKQLTRFGSMFKEEMEKSSNDALQETRTNLHSEALWSPALAQTEKTSQGIAEHLMTLKRYNSVILGLAGGCVHRLGETTWPWNYEASQKSIERRIVAAVKARNFQKAQRLDNYKAALWIVQTTGLCGLESKSLRSTCIVCDDIQGE